MPQASPSGRPAHLHMLLLATGHAISDWLLPSAHAMLRPLLLGQCAQKAMEESNSPTTPHPLPRVGVQACSRVRAVLGPALRQA